MSVKTQGGHNVFYQNLQMLAEETQILCRQEIEKRHVQGDGGGQCGTRRGLNDDDACAVRLDDGAIHLVVSAELGKSEVAGGLDR